MHNQYAQFRIPGQIAVHVTPEPAVSSAMVFVNPMMPCLAATYAALFAEATCATTTCCHERGTLFDLKYMKQLTSPCTDAMLMMRP